MSTLGILRAINREDASVAPAVRRAFPAIARAVGAAVRALCSGGRMFYVGAGTSGRLAALDAAECPPTFGTSAKMVQSVTAGGRRALSGAVEGAEDSAANGARDLKRRGVSARDLVVGIAASGETPYVLGAIGYAKRCGATTVGLTSNRDSTLERVAKVAIVVETGPEALTGSTRLKAGTAQKMVLNLLSTATMVRLGRVYDNWMIGVTLTNQKLKARALRILSEASGAEVSQAAHALRQSRHDLRIALIMLKTGVNAAEARRKLSRARGQLRQALGEK